MNILFITNQIPPLVDGVGDYTYNIATEFSKHKHKVYIVCKKNIQLSIQNNDITILPIIEQWNNYASKQIINLILEHNIDTVSLQYVPHGFHPKGIPYSLILIVKNIKSTKVKLMIFCHEVYVPFIKGNIKLFINSKLSKFVTKQILHQCDIIATSIDFYQKMIQKLCPDKKIPSPIPIVSNVPFSQLNEEQLSQLRDKIASQNEIIISFFGMRNISNSIKAIKELINQGEKIKVLFIGRTEEKIPFLQPQEYFRTGILSTNELDQYLQISDILILPENSIYGCSFKSGSLSAALRDGLCVVTAKGLLTSHEMIHNKNIVFTDFSQNHHIKQCLKELLLHSKKREIIGKNGALLTSSFTWENTYKAYINLITDYKHG